MLLSRDLKQLELDSDRFPRTWQALRSGLAEGVAPGFVVGLWSRRYPDEIRIAALGNRRQVPSPQPVTVDTVFDLASVSKIFATATLAALLVDRGWIGWDTRLRAILPEFRFPEIELRHLLSHTAGFLAWKPFWEDLRRAVAPCALPEISIEARQREMRRLVFAVDPEARPGQKALYSDLSFLLLGFALEEVTRMPLDRAVKELLWRPMGVGDATYRRVDRGPIQGRDESVAATELCPWRGEVLQGQVHDDNCWAMGGYAGHTGAFAPARDLLHFSRRLLGGFLSRETLRAAWARVEEPTGCERTLGWDTPSGENPAASRWFSPRSVGHLGFTGTSLWIDPDAELAFTLLTNRVHPSRENIKIRAFRPLIHQAIREDWVRNY